MGIVRQHLRRDMVSDGHHGLVASLRLAQLCDGAVPKIVETQPGKGTPEVFNTRAALLLSAGFCSWLHAVHWTARVSLRHAVRQVV